METRTINIIKNLDPREVSWASAFISNSNLPFIAVNQEFSPQTAINIFIGDTIPWGDIGIHSSFIVYYLAATSFNQILRSNKTAKEIEEENIRKADLVVITSAAELNLLKQAKLAVDFEKIIVGGFPVDRKRYLQYAETKKKADVCFVSDLSDVKNLAFQYELIPFLKNHGYTVSHFHSNETEEDLGMKKLGCKVYKRLPHEKFIKKLAEHRFCINVSKYESLSLSSIEAALLGCTPICPAHSGFLDWCNPGNFYASQDCNAVLSTLRSAKAMGSEEMMKYDHLTFYEKIISTYKSNR
ncbi:MAG: glycosyltransferase [Prevotellaceae bacterium]|jgi:hypothetical protein|nr:glycosyltransferase [Prevotellaceae bacterium]